MADIPRFFRDPGSHYFLFGPRGTGKSTWLRAAYPDALRVDLLDPVTQRACVARPEHLREMIEADPGRRVVVIDEIQKAPELLDVVHALIEESKGRQRFVLTGSSARKLRRTGVNLLGGRARERAMHPFMAAELGDRFRMERALAHGLIPGIWFQDDPKDALAAYVSLYVKEEVKDEGLVRDLGGFHRFLEAMSLSHGIVLNLANVARECEISRKTVEGYLQVLKDLLMGFEIEVFTRRAQRQLTVHPKFYLFDVGVFRALRPAGPLDRPEEIAGAALEGLVAQHLRAWIDLGRLDCKLHFWRTRNGSEVDFVVYGPDAFAAVEVKSRARVFPEDLRGLKAFREDYPEAAVTLLYQGRERLKIDGILCQPCAGFLRRLRPGRPMPS